jgi:hypothetical protein
VLNDALYAALQTRFNQEPLVCNPGQEALFSCPPIKRTRIGRSTKRYAVVEHWGECYAINCPACGDTRQRLYFSYLYEQSTKEKTVTYYFGRLCRCQNEKCDLRGYLADLKIPSEQVATKPSTFVGIVQQSVDLPKGCFPLLSKEVPSHILEYVYQRGFDPAMLMNQFFVHYAPEGTVWEEGRPATETAPEVPAKVLFEGRLLIPVIQGRHLVGFQLRRCQDLTKDKYKYLNSHLRKSRCLYNRDVAMYQRDVILVEGVTDVWRLGPNAMALFGKELNEYQKHLLKLLFGFSGRCLVCIDADDKAGQEKAEQLVETLRREQVFPRGVAQLRLPSGYDPASLSYAYLQNLQEEAWPLCK